VLTAKRSLERQISSDGWDSVHYGPPRIGKTGSCRMCCTGALQLVRFGGKRPFDKNTGVHAAAPPGKKGKKKRFDRSEYFDVNGEKRGEGAESTARRWGRGRRCTPWRSPDGRGWISSGPLSG